ncbi:MAG: cytochrome c5 family protein [Pseudomonadales bacterium]
MKSLLLALCIALALSACAEDQNTSETATAPVIEPSAQDIKRADNAEPQDPALAALYNRSCRTCHGVEGMNAPLTLHTAAWQHRLDQRSAQGLLQSARDGYQTMPAMGLCNDCSDADFNALIQFMSHGD